MKLNSPTDSLSLSSCFNYIERLFLQKQAEDSHLLENVDTPAKEVLSSSLHTKLLEKCFTISNLVVNKETILHLDFL